ncbi:MAG: histidine--tRNA ligase [Actinobacteria bacterium]|nr:histidine--tRNA ligase [Actinomycetota bacterium]
MSQRAQITPLSGFPEWLPEQRIVEQMLLDRIRRLAELYGFVPLETRAVEPLEHLVHQGETSKEIYTVGRLQDEGATADLGLHFDLTVPLARYVQEFRGRLRFPFKRYQIQKVWRGERPQDGRYREFYQADLDVVGDGELSLHFDAEMPAIMHELLAALPVPTATVLVSNRKVLDGFGRGLGRDDTTGIIRALDKLDKIGADGVRELLCGEVGTTDGEADRWLALAEIRSPDLDFVDAVTALGVSDDLLTRGLDELTTVVAASASLPRGAVVADLHIARGLDYYTGTVFESTIAGHSDLGSICSGGRYDDLASGGGHPLPGVGISVGVSRLLGRFLGGGQLRASRATPTCVLVALVDEGGRGRSAAIARRLRTRGIAAEVFHEPLRFGKQIRHADRRGIPFVWFPARGDDDTDSVRDLRSGTQVPADADAWMPPDADLHPAIESTAAAAP